MYSGRIQAYPASASTHQDSLSTSQSDCTAEASQWSLSERAFSKLKSVHSRFRHRRLVPVYSRNGVVSFTFDDFPASAAVEGAAILQARHARGTYYVSMGLKDKPWHGALGFSRGHIEEIVRAGHELACHTYGHRSCSAIAEGELQQEISLNQAGCAAAAKGIALSSFAYPFGHSSATAKKVIARYFMTARDVRKGVNAGAVDFLGLRANALCRSTNASEVISLVEECRRKHGWLIFYTHDVREHPSPWGSSPGLLEWAVDASHRLGCEILPVRDAAAALGRRSWEDVTAPVNSSRTK